MVKDHTFRHMSKQKIAIVILLTISLTSCGVDQQQARSIPSLPTPAINSERPKLLKMNPSLPVAQAWKEIDGKRVNVIPGLAFTQATIGAQIRATRNRSLTGEVVLIPTSSVWSVAGDTNYAGPVINLIGKTGETTNWSRLSIEITAATLRRSDGQPTVIPVHGHVVDAEDETSGVRCKLETPDFSGGQPQEPTVTVEANRQVVVFINEPIVLP